MTADSDGHTGPDTAGVTVPAPRSGSPLGGGSPSSLHRANLERVLHAIGESGALTQADIARQTGLSPASVSNLVRELESHGVVEVSDATSSGGRRARLVTVRHDVAAVIGVDFGHTHLRVAIGDLAHRVIAEEAVPMDVDTDADEGFNRAEMLVEALMHRTGTDRSKVVGVGLGVPGPVDKESGALGSSTILPGWVGLRPAEALQKLLGLPVVVDNDANLGALGELGWGVGRGRHDLVYVKVSSGVGAGLVLGGQLFRGIGGTAGEVGHITVDEQGPVCRCGNRGCLETYVGARYLLQLLAPTFGAELTVEQVVRGAIEGHTGFRRALADTGRQLGVGVASLCNIVNPGLVVIGGDLAGAGDLLLGPVREVVQRYAIPSAARQVRIVQGELGDRAEVLGALSLVLREMAHVELLAGRTPTVTAT